MVKSTKKREYRFGQILVTYHLILVISLIVLGTILFAIVFRQLSQLQMQNGRYVIVSELATSIHTQKETFKYLVFEQNEIKREEYVETINIQEKIARESLTKLSTTYENNKDQYFLLRGIANGLDFINQQKKLILSSFPLDAKGFTTYYTVDTTYQYLYEYVYSRFLSNAVHQDSKAVMEMKSSITQLQNISLSLLILLSIIYTIAIIAIVRSLVHPIEKMVFTANEITKGNLETSDLVENGPTEIRFLEKTLNLMKSSLIERMATIDENVRLEKRLHQQELQQVIFKRELDRARLVTLQAQINPHFLFNAMNTINRTALFENADKTGELVNDLALLFRYIFDQRSSVPLFEEIEFISKYLKIQKVRFGERLRYSITSDSEVNNLLIPPLLIQPFVENAIIHGLEPLESGCEVTVTITHTTRILTICIVDDGVGYDESKKNPTKDRHVGIANASQRIELYYGKRGQLTINQRDEGGTKVLLKLPIRKNDWV